MNGHRNGLMRIPLDSTHGVVLSLRNRYSMLRKKVARRAPVAANGDNGEPGSPHEVHPLATETHASNNPWVETDASGPSSHAPTHLHRLSFDPASGVIMLPEGDDWLVDDDDDSSDEYGNGTPPSGEATSATPSQEDLAGAPTSPSPSASPKRRHHGTYYHHPERRRVSVPGAFPS